MSRISTSVIALGVPDPIEFLEPVDVPVAGKKPSKSDTATVPVAETEETP